MWNEVHCTTSCRFLLWHDTPPLQDLLKDMNPGGWQLQAVTPVGQLEIDFLEEFLWQISEGVDFTWDQH